MTIVLDTGTVISLLGLLALIVVQSIGVGIMFGSLRTRVAAVERVIAEDRLVLSRLASIEADLKNLTKAVDSLVAQELVRKQIRAKT